jgi:hypothetical protein
MSQMKKLYALMKQGVPGATGQFAMAECALSAVILGNAEREGLLEHGRAQYGPAGMTALALARVGMWDEVAHRVNPDLRAAETWEGRLS